MRRWLTALGMTAVVFAAIVAQPPAPVIPPVPPGPQPAPAFARGAKPSPPHKLAAAPRFTAKRELAPAQLAMVPTRLSVWGNNQYGVCVTSEEAYAKGAWSAHCGLPNTFIPEAEVVRWARAHGVLNGATLVEVLDAMERDPLKADDGKSYLDGPAQLVDYSNEGLMRQALATGPVKIAIDANALPRGAGNQQGWFAVGGRPMQFPNTDHAVGLSGYGPAKFLFEQIKAPLPAALPADKQGYLLFTWGTIGFVDQQWIMSTCVEAWVRNPTTPGQSPAPVPPPVPPPQPDPGPQPQPPGGPFTGSLVYKDGVVVGVIHGGQPAGGLEAELKAAAVDPALIAAVLKLVQDIKAKAGPKVILADVFAILALLP